VPLLSRSSSSNFSVSYIHTYVHTTIRGRERKREGRNASVVSATDYSSEKKR
jgi:hypothetical protein